MKWRHDYQAAFIEAKESERPLVIDFGTSNCIWCKKLAASTFHDEAVVKQMNEAFIPVKIDAERESTLAQSMKVHSYPTLVLRFLRWPGYRFPRRVRRRRAFLAASSPGSCQGIPPAAKITLACLRLY